MTPKTPHHRSIFLESVVYKIENEKYQEELRKANQKTVALLYHDIKEKENENV